jgi:hypothetical protein
VTDQSNALDHDVDQAGALLYDLAVVLRCVPLSPETRDLHVRALELKRDVGRWASEQPPAPLREAAIREILDLRRQASMWLGARAG